MTATRKNISDVTARSDFINAVLGLKAEMSGVMTSVLNMPGPDQELSTYDLFVFWHAYTMMIPTHPDGGNAAHGGPVFLPWHRWMLILLELHMQRILGNANFGLPYWDWAMDGDLPQVDQESAPIWTWMGSTGSPVTDGPFNDQVFTVRVGISASGSIESINRGISRNLADSVTTLPRTNHVTAALGLSTYDRSGWGRSAGGFRSRVEGWTGNPDPHLHNRVHVWVGGDMLLGTSPNDPIFFLNHCNEDRIWESWLVSNNRNYVPIAPNGPQGHRLNDNLVSILTQDQPEIASMLDASNFYSYDQLP